MSTVPGHTRPAPVAGRRSAGLSRLISPMLLLAGAGLYAAAEGPGGITFYVTPLSVGVIALVAGLVGEDRHLVPAGFGIAGWGSAVALVHYHVVPSARTTPAYMVGLVAGVLLASYLAPRAQRGAWVHSAAVSATTAAVFYFVAFGEPSLGRWPAWAISLIVWAAWLAAKALPAAGRAATMAGRVRHRRAGGAAPRLRQVETRPEPGSPSASIEPGL